MFIKLHVAMFNIYFEILLLLIVWYNDYCISLNKNKRLNFLTCVLFPLVIRETHQPRKCNIPTPQIYTHPQSCFEKLLLYLRSSQINMFRCTYMYSICPDLRCLYILTLKYNKYFVKTDNLTRKCLINIYLSIVLC